MTPVRLAWALVALTFCLLVVGGMVHATGSSLACPDWPLCYGQAFPEMRGGVLFEHSHRLLATAVGLVTFVLAILFVRRVDAGQRVRGPAIAIMGLVFVQQGVLMAALTGGRVAWAWLALVLLLVVVAVGLVALVYRRGAELAALGLLAFVLVGAQGMLGGLTVVLKLPLLVSAAHLALSVAFFGLVLYLGFRLQPPPPAPSAPVNRAAVGWVVLLVYLQIVWGGFVRHTGAGLACNVTVLSCDGTLAPTGGPAWLNWGHRLFAVAVVMVAAWVLGSVVKAAAPRQQRLVQLLAWGGLGAAVLQLGVGALTVATFIAVGWVVLHLAVAALWFALVVALYLTLGRPRAAGTA